jgi:ribosomal protein L34
MTINQLENLIFRVEGFQVRILHLNGRDVRSDKRNLPRYPFERMRKNASSVREWKTERFCRAYPGFDAEVLHTDGRRAHGRTRLSTVRDTYLGD